MPAAQAQLAPDAGAIRQQIERDLPAAPAKPLRLPPTHVDAVAPKGGVTVQVRALRFEGNTLLTEAQLQRAVAPWVGRSLDYAGLQEAAAAVGEAYRANGWVARVLLPRQDVENGVVTIKVIEARFGALRVDGPSPARVPLAQVLSYLQAQLKPGQALNTLALERGLMLADDLPGVVVSGSLVEGAGEGQTDVMLRLADEPLLMGDLVADNTGARATGNVRLAADVQLTSPLHMGDLLNTNLIHTEGSDYARAEFTVPAGPQGLRVGANASWLKYSLIAPEFARLKAYGWSGSSGVMASYPVLRSHERNLVLSGNYDYRTFDNRANGAVSSRYVVQDFTLGLSGNRFDSLGEGGVNAANAQLVGSWVDLGGSPTLAADAATTRTAGLSVKLRYGASRQQTLTHSLSLYASLAGQWAGKNQDSSEKFYLGGANGVRAYPVNEGGGASGQLVNLELRAQLPHELVLIGFYDWGHVDVDAHTGFVGAPALNSYVLQGAGLSLGWHTEKGVTLKATLARRLGSNPNPTPAGKDQDGSRILDRAWFSAMWSI